MDLTKNFHFQVGAIDCIAINDGIETVPLESIIRDLPLDVWKEALLDKGEPATAETTFYFNSLYLQTGQNRVLIDAGWGKGVQRRDGLLLDRLQDEGISPADIDTLIFTHEDVDHYGGILTPDGALTFPQASYILPKEAWDFWTNPTLLTRWPEFLTTFARQGLPAIRERVKVAAAGDEFLPGFQFIPAPGHRPGHSAISITSAGLYLLHLGDTVGHPLFMEHPEWHWYPDFQPGQAEKDKRKLIALAVSQNAVVFGAHLPFPAVGRVIPQGEAWRWVADS